MADWKGARRRIPDCLKGKGWVVVGVNNRLLPKVTIRETMDDVAEAVVRVFRHAADYGGYIDILLCLNKSWLAAYGPIPIA